MGTLLLYRLGSELDRRIGCWPQSALLLHPESFAA
jgi:hypothetical protein